MVRCCQCCRKSSMTIFHFRSFVRFIKLLVHLNKMYVLEKFTQPLSFFEAFEFQKALIKSPKSTSYDSCSIF